MPLFLPECYAMLQPRSLVFLSMNVYIIFFMSETFEIASPSPSLNDVLLVIWLICIFVYSMM